MAETPPETKQCPYCAETILAAAIVCKHCGRDLTGTGAGSVTVLPPEKKKSSAGLILLLIVIGIVVLCTCVPRGGNNTPAPAAAPTTYNVKYEVTGKPTSGSASQTYQSASLTYQNETGNTEQKDVKIPWSETFTAPPGEFLYISAQLDGTGIITCKIYLNGQVWQEATSQGDFVIAKCSGSAGSND